MKNRCLAGLLAISAFAQTRNLDALSWRFVGPWRAGRVVSAVGVKGDPNVYYQGAVGGGLWKSTNAGLTWKPLFDAQPVASIGSIAVAPSDPNIIYAGTGETDIRSDLATGDGVYKSTDGGATWTHIGLRDTRHIGRVLVHPRSADTVFVAALGHAYGPNAERGLYRSTNGGRSWTKVLDRGPETGAVDVAMDPDDPQLMYACFWNARRPAWSQYGPVEGAGSGLWQSKDGGTTWTQLAGHGLPAGEWRRSGVAVARGHRVYLTLDGAEPGIYRSDDSGANWSRVSTDRRVTSRGWYFGQIAADPNDPDVLYAPNVSLYRSRDGGKTFEVIKGAPGGDDYHSAWIDPADSRRIITGSDQGVAVSVDFGVTWTPWYNQPTAQIYHVAADNQFPYLLYGAQQDSGTAVVPSRSRNPVITEYDRTHVGGAESGSIQPDPGDPNIVYVNNTYGSLARYDKRTHQSQNITPWPVASFGTEMSQRKYRATWTSPLEFSPLEPGTLYFGAQFLLKTTDGGLHWSEASPDLTGEPRGVIYSISASPRDKGLIWVGTDTGLVQVTRDGGKSWSAVTPPGLSQWSKITHIEASRFDPGTAYAAVDRHRLDDYRPHLYRTRDFGKTWTEVVNGIAPNAFLNAVREDPSQRGLLFAATESGVVWSSDDGDYWQSLQRNLPAVSVRDVIVKGDDLAIATHGRGFWILDNFSALREKPAAGVHFYKPSRAVRMHSDGFQGTPMPPETPQAPNPPEGAVFDYELSAAQEVTLEVADSAGRVVFSTADAPAQPRRGGGGGSGGPTVAPNWIQAERRITGNAGLNRYVWNLRYSSGGPLVMPGRYTARLSAGGRVYEQSVEVVMDPGSLATAAELAAQHELSLRAWAALKRARQMGNATAISYLSSAIEVAQSADRTPPATAYALVEMATAQLGGR